MKYLNKPIITFDSVNDTGVNKIPIDSLVHVTNSEGEHLLISVISVSGFNDESTVSDLLNSDNYKGLFIDDTPYSSSFSLFDDSSPELSNDLIGNGFEFQNPLNKDTKEKITTLSNVSDGFSLDVTDGNYFIIELDGHSYLNSIYNARVDSYTEIHCLFIPHNFAIEFGDIEFSDNIRATVNNLLIKFFTFDGVNWNSIIIDADVEDNIIWDLSGASYANNTVQMIDADLKGITFKPDGTMFILALRTGHLMATYILSTPWDISTAVLDKTVEIAITYIDGLYVNDEGDKLYTVDNTNLTVCQYNMSTLWDIDTLSYVNESVILDGGNPNDIWFRPDGLMMWCGDMEIPRGWDQYTLSVPWDISTLEFNNKTLISDDQQPRNGRLSPNGKILWVLEGNDMNIQEYSLIAPWDVSTASLVSEFSLDTWTTNDCTAGMYVNYEGTKIYVIECGSLLHSINVSN